MSSSEAEYVAAARCCANILDHIVKGDIELHFIPTQYQLADIFPKPLDEPTFKILTVEPGRKTGGLDQISTKDATILYCLANRVLVDYAKLIWEDLIHKLNKKTREKIVPYPRFISLLFEHRMPEYDNKELTVNPTQVFSVHNWTLNPNQPEESPFTAHMKAICNLDVHVDSKAPEPSSQTEEVPQGKKPGAKRSNPSVLVDKTKSTRDGLKTAHTDSGENESAFFNPDSPPNEPIIIPDKSEEEEEVARDKDTKAISHDVPKDTSVLPPSSPKSTQIQELMAQLTELLVTSLKPNLSKLLASHNFTSCLPTELKELLSKITRLSGEIKELKKHVRDIEIELPEDLKEILTKLETFTSIISCLSTHSSFFSSRKAQDFRFSSKSFHILTDTLNRFATMVENVSGATSMNVPLVVKNVVTQYYTKKLFFDKCCDKMLKRKKSPKITKCEVLTKKGCITLKIYKEDGSDELISNIKVSDLHSGEWREVIQACPNKSEKGWKTIDDCKDRLESSLNPKLNKNLRLDFNKPRKEQDPLNELNKLANNKRKRTIDLKDHSRSTKKHKSSSSA
ncbi:hypothetical protein Tco_1430212 [Tanacetum coccineum]